MIYTHFLSPSPMPQTTHLDPCAYVHICKSTRAHTQVHTCTYAGPHHWPYALRYSSHSLPLTALPFIHLGDLGSKTNLFLLKHTKTTLNKLAMQFHLKSEINTHHLTKPHSDKLSYKEFPTIAKPENTCHSCSEYYNLLVCGLLGTYLHFSVTPGLRQKCVAHPEASNSCKHFY